MATITNPRERREVALERNFLGRCCIQVSCPLSQGGLHDAIRYAAAFAKRWVPSRPDEVSRALVWRVMDSEEGSDRLGAWFLLDEVIKLSVNCTELRELPDRLHLFLAPLIKARWGQFVAMEIAARARGAIGSDLNLGSAAMAAQSPALLNESSSIVKGYEELHRSWKGFWKGPVLRAIEEAITIVEDVGYSLNKSAISVLSVPVSFSDLLWKLRRNNSRPSTALQVYQNYRVVSDHPGGTGGNLATTAELSAVPKEEPTRILDKMEPMHPKVRAWILRLLKEEPCQFCDTWAHKARVCPCSLEITRSIKPMSQTMAISILERAETITDKRRPEMGQVLDFVAKLMRQNAPYGDFLNACDTLAGSLTGRQQRWALSILSSYSIRPSDLVLTPRWASGIAPGTGERKNPALETARERFRRVRRFAELKQFEAAVEVLRCCSIERRLPPHEAAALQEVTNTNSFFFILLDDGGEFSVTDSNCAREVETLSKYADVLCQKCLEPFHYTENCTVKREVMWDQNVAAHLLEKNGVFGIKYPDDESKIADAMDKIEIPREKRELEIAVELLLKRKDVSYCGTCKKYGHRRSACRFGLERTMKNHRLNEGELRLNPTIIERAIEDLSRAEKPQYIEDETKRERATKDLQQLQQHIKGCAFPREFREATDTLRREEIEVVAARYFPDVVEQYCRFRNNTPALLALSSYRSVSSPYPCLFCSDFSHGSADCREIVERDGIRIKEILQQFFQVIQQAGVSLGEIASASTPAAHEVINTIRLRRNEKAAEGLEFLERKFRRVRERYALPSGMSGTPMRASSSNRLAGIDGTRLSRIKDAMPLMSPSPIMVDRTGLNTTSADFNGMDSTPLGFGQPPGTEKESPNSVERQGSGTKVTEGSSPNHGEMPRDDLLEGLDVSGNGDDSALERGGNTGKVDNSEVALPTQRETQVSGGLTSPDDQAELILPHRNKVHLTMPENNKRDRRVAERGGGNDPEEASLPRKMSRSESPLYPPHSPSDPPPQDIS